MQWFRRSVVRKFAAKFPQLNRTPRAYYTVSAKYSFQNHFRSNSAKKSKIWMCSVATGGIGLSVMQYNQIHAATNDAAVQAAIVIESLPEITKEAAAITVAGATTAAGTVAKAVAVAKGAMTVQTAALCVAGVAGIAVIAAGCYIGYYTYSVHYDKSETNSECQYKNKKYISTNEVLLQERYFATYGNPAVYHWNHPQKAEKKPLAFNLGSKKYVIVLKADEGEFAVTDGNQTAKKYLPMVCSDIKGPKMYENPLTVSRTWIFDKKIQLTLDVECIEEGSLDIWLYEKKLPPTIMHEMVLRLRKFLKIEIRRIEKSDD